MHTKRMYLSHFRDLDATCIKLEVICKDILNKPGKKQFI